VRSVSTGLVILATVGLFSGAAVGCSSAAVTEPWEVPTTSDEGGGTSSSGGGSSGGGDAGASMKEAGGMQGSPDSSLPAVDAGAAEASTKDSSAPAEAGVDAGSVTSDDGFSASRTVCINKINALRATDTAVALKALTLENTDTVNTCVNTQASTDQSKNSAHYAFINNDPSCTWGSANGFAQDECEEGYGTTPAGIEQCLQDMWDESTKPNCAGCIGCTAFGGACPNCDYSGSKGYECGHYVNMSAPYFTMVACGFAGAAPSSSSGWAVQNFE
jgi:hypothetical protein